MPKQSNNIPIVLVLLLGMSGCGGPTVRNAHPATKPLRPTIEQRLAHVPKTADKIVLYSLAGDVERKKFSDDAEVVQGYVVLGKVEITDSVQIDKILTAFRKDISVDFPLPLCFDPHHAIEVHNSGSIKTYVICYLCSQFESYIDPDFEFLPISATNKSAIFDKHFAKAGIKVATGSD